VALGDLDGDGDLDAFVANYGQANKVWVNNGDGNFTAGQGLGSAYSYGVALGDLDGDGDLDAFVTNYGGGQANKVWLNVTPRPVPVGGIWVPVDKLGLLAPYIALAITIIVATVATATLVKHRKKQ